MLGKPLEELKLVSCHLGNGSSITAIEGGKSIDTTMGFTPLAGLLMGTRCGDIDPAIVTFLMDKENLSVKELNDVMNKKSGILGITGISSDFRDIEDAAAEGNEIAEVGLNMFNYEVLKYIGAYAAAMGGLDAIIFTAGVGEHNPVLRKYVADKLSGIFGTGVDDEKNKLRGVELDISVPEAKTRILVIPTDEEMMIALETKALVG